MWWIVAVALILQSVVQSQGLALSGSIKKTESSATRTLTNEMAARRLASLRQLMTAGTYTGGSQLAAYIVPTADAHQSEYIASTDARREWISGFTGSAGTVIVTDDRALLWTDGRYYAQALQELDAEFWELMRTALPETPTTERWLVSNLPRGAIVGADPELLPRTEWTTLSTTLTKAGLSLMAVRTNLVDQARVEVGDPAPARPHNDVHPLSITYTGQSVSAKLSELQTKMTEKGADAYVVTALDEVAYLLNLRGSDIPYNPVFFAYAVVRSNGTVAVFWSDGQLSFDILEHFVAEGVSEQMLDGRPYNDVYQYLEDLAVELSSDGNTQHTIWLSHSSSEAIHISAAGGDNTTSNVELLSEVSPLALMKVVKNDVEIEGMRRCHIRDGTALIRFFRWLHEQIDAGNTVTEVSASDRLLEFRKEEANFVGESFGTIAGAGANGAIIHYSANREGEQRQILPTDVFLLDSGGQYLDGTTDVTRTRHMSASPSPAQKDAFTRVLKGQMLLGTAVFPRSIKGNVLDTLARKALWDVGLDYAHGTGHGVGHYLNVHEGPSGISWRTMPDDPGLVPNMIFSNEPGYYEEGSYGIRHEDLVEVIDLATFSRHDFVHPKKDQLLGNFAGQGALGFFTITLAPQQREFINIDLLTDDEIAYLDAYHARVYSTIAPILQERGLADDVAWLERATRPLRWGSSSSAQGNHNNKA